SAETAIDGQHTGQNVGLPGEVRRIPRQRDGSGTILDQVAGSRQLAIETAIAVLVEYKRRGTDDRDMALQAVCRARQRAFENARAASVAGCPGQLHQTTAPLHEPARSAYV